MTNWRTVTRPRLDPATANGADTAPAKAPARAHRDRVPEGCPLTVRELEVLGLVMQGLSAKEIAPLVHRGASTVRTQTFTACQRLGVNSGVQAVLVCVKAGWLNLDGTQGPPAPPKPPPEPEPQVTPAQALYLEAFDRWLRSGDAEDRLEMTMLARIVRRQGGAHGMLRDRLEAELQLRRSGDVPRRLMADLAPPVGSSFRDGQAA